MIDFATILQAPDSNSVQVISITAIVGALSLLSTAIYKLAKSIALPAASLVRYAAQVDSGIKDIKVGLEYVKDIKLGIEHLHERLERAELYLAKRATDAPLFHSQPLTAEHGNQRRNTDG